MGFWSKLFTGVDLEAEQARETQLDAAGKVQADRYKAGGDIYEKIEDARGADVAYQESQKVQANYASEVTQDVEQSVLDEFYTGIQDSVPVKAIVASADVTNSVGKFAVKTIWHILPWYVWVFLIGGLIFYVFVQIKPFLKKG